MSRTLASLALVATATSGMIVAAPSAAQATGFCGANYNTVGSASIPSADVANRYVGTLRVEYNPGNGYWCVQTLPNSSTADTRSRAHRIGEPTNWVSSGRKVGHTEVWLFANGQRCVIAEGTVWGSTTSTSGGLTKEFCR